MQPSSFEYVPQCDIPDFVARDPLENTEQATPPPVPPRRSIEEIVISSNVQSQAPEPAQSPVSPEERSKRLYIPVTARQREILAEEWAKHGIEKSLKYYEDKTRICASSLRRLIRDIRSGKDITKPARRGRKPKYTPELLKKIVSELCVRNKTLREAKSAIIDGNIEEIRNGNEPLPVVSVSTMSRYLRNEAVMDEVDIGPLSFTEVTKRGRAANSEENKTLRIERRRQLDSFISGGYTVVFVDESHWEVGNVRTRGWGPRGEKHFRTLPNGSVAVSCICSISDSGRRHCMAFHSTINADIFRAYMKELISLYRLDNESVVFVMDNASIHKDGIQELAQQYRCDVMFNAPYSPECNPIEMIFGTWKSRVGKLSSVDIADLLRNIAACFEGIAASEVKRNISHFLGEVTTKIMNRQDL